jgi:hypothetical protein
VAKAGVANHAKTPLHGLIDPRCSGASISDVMSGVLIPHCLMR